MKKVLPFIWILVPAILILFVVFGKNGKSSFSSKETILPLKKGEIFDKIVIESSLENYSLELQNGKWLVDNSIEAGNSKILAMIEVLENLQMKFPAPKEQSAALIDSVRKNGISLSLLNRGKTVYSIKFFDIDRQSVVLSRKGKPFFAEIRAFPGITPGMVIFDDKTMWYKNLLFNFSFEEIATVHLKIDSIQEKGFEIINSANEPEVSTLNGNIIKETDKENIIDYLHFFDGICYLPRDIKTYTEDFSNPVFSLDINLKSNRKISLNGFNLYQSNSGLKDINIFAGIVNNSDTIYLNYSDLDPILTSIDYFLKK